MLNKMQIVVVPIAVVCLLQCGCLLNHSNHVVLRQGEPLRGLSFQSEETRDIFEQAVDQAKNDDSRKSRASFGVPFLIGLERSRTLGDSAVRNDIGNLFDIDQDGFISDYEASLRSQ